MSEWLGLGSICELLAKLPQPDPGLEFRISAGLLAVSMVGGDLNTAASMTNVAGVYLSGGNRQMLAAGPAMYQLIKTTHVDNFPSVCPVLLEQSGIIEAKRPELPLFGSTSSIGWYWLEGVMYLVGIDYPDGAFVGRIEPTWTGEKIESGNIGVVGALGKDAIDDWTRAAARYLITFALILEAQDTPVTVMDGRVNIRRGQEQLLRATIEFEVRGHLRHQAHGPMHSLRKWIWITEHISRR